MSKSKLSGFKPQRVNANKHKPFGLKLLDDSIQRDGWIGAMTVAADGETFAGSARLERSADIFGTEIEPLIVHSTGDRPIIVIRDDIPNADDPRAKRLAVADNLIPRADYDPDLEILRALGEEDDLIKQLIQQDAALMLVLEGEGVPNVEFKEYDESTADDVKYCECPACHHKFPA